MTPEQQQIAIGKAHGWKECWITQNGTPWGFLGANHYSQPIPNYLNDLNAMHEVEKVLTSEQVTSYVYSLELMNERWATPAFATASQRAEAFLRTIGKWEESK